MNPKTRMTAARLLLVSLAVAAISLIVVAGASAAVPQNTSQPTITGTAREGQTLTASDGVWSNSPTSFSYQWQRCASDGTGCGDITAATSKTYTLVSGDVGHTLRVAVTASNAEGKGSADSAPTDVVASKNGPTNTVKPAVSGAAVVGDTLAVGNGSWTSTPTSYTRQWQRCATDGTACFNISGATGRTYGVRSSDLGRRLRALVTAHTSAGQAGRCVERERDRHREHGHDDADDDDGCDHAGAEGADGAHPVPPPCRHAHLRTFPCVHAKPGPCRPYRARPKGAGAAVHPPPGGHGCDLRNIQPPLAAASAFSQPRPAARDAARIRPRTAQQTRRALPFYPLASPPTVGRPRPRTGARPAVNRRPGCTDQSGIGGPSVSFRGAASL